MACGIYCFTVGSSDKPYIGQSINIGSRIKTHERIIKEGKASKKVQNEANIFGEEIKYIILEECSSEELDFCEIKWIEEFNSIEEGLNTSKGGEAWGGLGIYGGNAKFTRGEILEVIDLLIKGDRGYEEISKLCRLHASEIADIHKGKVHRWIEQELPELYNVMINTKVPRAVHMESFFIQHKVTKEIVEVKKRNETADALGINRHALSMVKNGTRKHTGGWELYKEKAL